MNTGIDSSKNLASSNGIFPMTITLSLSNEHFLDSSFYSKELDMKIGILKLSNAPIPKEKSDTGSSGGGGNKASIPVSQSSSLKDSTNLNQIINDISHRKTPKLTVNSDF
jgi:hypothetical protein